VTFKELLQSGSILSYKLKTEKCILKFINSPEIGEQYNMNFLRAETLVTC
jgi:hypothetical protein